MSKEVVTQVIRACGRKYLKSEIEEATASLPDPVPKQAFLDFMQSPYTDPTPTDLKNALGAFDGDDLGELRMGELIACLTTLGEKIPHEEATKITADIPIEGNGAVKISEIVRVLTEPILTVSPNIEDLMRSLPGV